MNNLFGQNLISAFTEQFRLLTTTRKKSFENEDKGENAGHLHFLLFPKCFQPSQRKIASRESQ